MHLVVVTVVVVGFSVMIVRCQLIFFFRIRTFHRKSKTGILVKVIALQSRLTSPNWVISNIFKWNFFVSESVVAAFPTFRLPYRGLYQLYFCHSSRARMSTLASFPSGHQKEVLHTSHILVGRPDSLSIYLWIYLS